MRPYQNSEYNDPAFNINLSFFPISPHHHAFTDAGSHSFPSRTKNGHFWIVVYRTIDTVSPPRKETRTLHSTRTYI